MALLDLQRVLTRLYTETGYRTTFFANGAEVISDPALSTEERAQLCRLNRTQVERFAASLRSQRLGSATRLLPATAHVLGREFTSQFSMYCNERPPTQNATDDAHAFAGYLLAGGLDGPPYSQDVVRCEQLQIEVIGAARRVHDATTCKVSCEPAQRPRVVDHLRIASFQYDLEVLYPLLTAGEVPDPERDPCVILIGAVSGAAQPRLRRLNAATAQLLKLTDGTRTLETIVDLVATSLRLDAPARTRFGDECTTFLAPFLASGLVLVEGEHIQ